LRLKLKSCDAAACANRELDATRTLPISALNANLASISMERDYEDLGSPMVVRVKSFHTRCLFPAGPESARTKSPPRLALAAWGKFIAPTIRSSAAPWLCWFSVKWREGALR
jgi:hypothetical protein